MEKNHPEYGRTGPHLKDEGLVEDRTQVLPLDFGLVLLLLVRQHVDFDVRVGRAAHVHGCQVLGLEDSHDQLGKVNRK